MNRQMIIKITSQLLINYLNNNSLLTEDEFSDLITNIPYEITDDNKATLYEQQMTVLLFKNVPYYKVIDCINDFLRAIKDEYKDTKLKATTFVINGYLSEYKAQIKERIRQEVFSHLYMLVNDYYTNKKLTISANDFLKNMYLPEEISSIHIAEQINYEQISMFEEQQVDIHDEISKINCQNKEMIQSKLKKTIKSRLDKNEQGELLTLLYNYIRSLDIIGYYKELLIRIYFKELESCINSINNAQPKSDGYTYVMTIK